MENSKTLADYVAIVKRRFTISMITFVLVIVGGVYVAYSIPPLYRSTSTISIEQQVVASEYAQTAVTSYADEQIERIWQSVMSSATLADVVTKYGLYPEIVVEGNERSIINATYALRESTLLESQTIQFMNRQSGRASGATIAFTLSFDYSDGATAQEVAVELTDRILSKNIQDRTNQAQNTVDFLKTDIDSARAEMDRTSDALASFKERHAGNLPELLNFHLQSIERTEQQLDNLDREIRDSRNRQFTLETEVARTNPFANSVDGDGNPILGTADRLAELQSERLRLLSIYTPQHADVIRIEREIEMLAGSEPSSASPNASALRTQLDAILAELQESRRSLTEDHPDVVRLKRSAAVLEQQIQQAQSTGQQQSSLASLASRDPVVQQLRQQIQTEQSYLGSLLGRRTELESKLDELRGRVAAMPQIERDYAVLVQNNEAAIARYNAAVARLDDAQRAQTLEVTGGAERLTLLEAPLLPINPYAPNRPMIVIVFLILALGCAFGLAVLSDSFDETVRGSKEVAELAGAPPIAVIPVLETRLDRYRRWAVVAAKSAFFAGGMVTAYSIAATMG